MPCCRCSLERALGDPQARSCGWKNLFQEGAVAFSYKGKWAPSNQEGGFINSCFCSLSMTLVPAVPAKRFVLAQCISASRGKVFPGFFFFHTGHKAQVHGIQKNLGWWMEGRTGDRRPRQKNGAQNRGRIQERAKENKKDEEGGRNLLSMYFII